MFSYRTQTLIVASCVAVIMLSLRVTESGGLSYIFLAWNLLLAWVPFIVSHYLLRLNAAYKWKTALLFFTWLVFLPNAPYLITDFIHLHKRPGIPLLFDVVMLFLFSFTGIALGSISVLRMEQWCRKNHPAIPVAALQLVVFLLCGFGIYLGRVERFNSWDVLANPGELSATVMGMCIHPFSNAYAWGLTLVFALLSWIPYTFFRTIPAGKKSLLISYE